MYQVSNICGGDQGAVNFSCLIKAIKLGVSLSP